MWDARGGWRTAISARDEERPRGARGSLSVHEGDTWVSMNSSQERPFSVSGKLGAALTGLFAAREIRVGCRRAPLLAVRHQIQAN